MSKTHKPWGTYEVLFTDEYCQVKVITVLPGQRLSLQSHKLRREHWFIASGTAAVRVGDEERTLQTGQSVDIAIGQKHRIGATGSQELSFIEIQTGTYFGEDDIVRYEDDYGR
ncbi:MAG TPA: phosphomannose isomerase type II C-terminal cupin domain [Candidatus Nanopelagicaceae bacterium]|nr:phosphomannose isomerase type II C-terminal cupin domain [Candidatus Nanopelagicaceae bacterium]